MRLPRVSRPGGDGEASSGCRTVPTKRERREEVRASQESDEPLNFEPEYLGVKNKNLTTSDRLVTGLITKS